MRISLEKATVIASILLSALAVLFSAYSVQEAKNANRIALDAYDLANKEYIESKTLIVTGSIDNDQNRVAFKSQSDDFNIQRLAVKFPSYFENAVTRVPTKDHTLSIQGLAHDIAGYAQNESELVQSLGKDQLAMLEGSVPFVLKANYTVDGNVFESMSLYLIRYKIVVMSSDIYLSADSVAIDSISFVEHLNVSGDYTELLNFHWDSFKM